MALMPNTRIDVALLPIILVFGITFLFSSLAHANPSAHNSPVVSGSKDLFKNGKFDEGAFKKLYLQQEDKSTRKFNHHKNRVKSEVPSTEALVKKENGKFRLNSSNPKAKEIKNRIAEEVQSKKLKQGSKNGTDIALKEQATKLTSQILAIMLRPMMENTGEGGIEQKLYQEKLFETQVTSVGINGFEKLRDAIYEEFKASAGRDIGSLK